MGEEFRRSLDELARQGARRMIEWALQVEVEDYIERHRQERDDDGRALVVRNGSGKALLHAAMNAPSRKECDQAIDDFVEAYLDCARSYQRAGRGRGSRTVMGGEAREIDPVTDSMLDGQHAHRLRRKQQQGS